MASENQIFEPGGNQLWRQAFFSGCAPIQPSSHPKNGPAGNLHRSIGDTGALWLRCLFAGIEPHRPKDGRLRVLKVGSVVYEASMQELGNVTVIGRHPRADLQLESNKMAPFHAVILRHQGKFYLESLDDAGGTQVNRKQLPPKKRVPLYGDIQIDLPDYRLELSLSDRRMPTVPVDMEGDIPDSPAKVPPPALAVAPTGVQGGLEIWGGGIIRLQVVDIVEETHDCKTFCLAGLEPMLFSYKPGQFITFILNIDGKEVRRSYSLSSTPSRPYLLEVTVKRVPGGLVSNWFCDRIRPGDELLAKGPLGHFTCFDQMPRKILFLAAGSGIVPVFSMCRWLADTAANVDVKLLASFKSRQDIIYWREFEMLSARSRRIRTAITLTSVLPDEDYWTGFSGRICPPMLAEFAPDLHERDVFLCGPDPFAHDVERFLRDLGYDMSRYHTESFGTGRSAPLSSGNPSALRLKEPLYKVKFTKSGKIVDTDQHLTLLELAEAHGIEVDYSCRVGSCGECEMKCRGDVHVSSGCEIDEKTRKAGFVYGCCTTARSDLELDI
ncbi:FAD-binding oxidoreductase [Methylomicrobium sp. RS1]|uniref:FAD-binding oxidoreductase n=1 Tax=Candidatus Methylomicrobium oryzae TaxID=2802053 RepID=UPI0019244B28|nr:FAD-binding oxidoreductase [Methylomicrobium sp. RS1]MBL1263274.1 FHA domain-containing protein [Methylomicrobium sp. RS1]